jgi:alpha-glucosidase
LQFGAFSPILRTHAAQNPDAERRIWAYPEPYADVMREAFVLRQALLPYVYTEARRTYDSGVAFLRPLYYDWPDADEAYGAKNEYLFGDNLIVAPVVQAVDPKSGLVEEKLWLPTGNWIEWPTGAHITGPKTIARKFSISQIPVYVKSGSIVPMQPEMRYSNERPVDPLIVNVFTLEDGQTSWYRLYEDAGTALDYKRDQCAWTELRARRLGNTLSVEIGRGQGRFDGMPAARGYEIRLPGDWPPESVTVNGKPAAWRFEGGTLSTVIRVASIPVSQAVRVEVKTLAALQPRRGDLAGVAGALVRLREAYDSLNRMGSGGWSPDELVEAMQTGTRLSYRPEEAGPEVEQFRQRMAKLPAVIEALRATGGQAAAQWRNEMIDRALAQVADAIEVAG